VQPFEPSNDSLVGCIVPCQRFPVSNKENATRNNCSSDWPVS
jgi:hypothetical protein